MAERARQALDEDLAPVTQRHPGLEVDRAVVWDNASSALVKASRSATAVVLPGPAERPMHTVADASVTVAAHARCPVIGVPHSYAGAWRPPRRVVLAFDGSPESAEAAEFAFAQAARWSVPLSAVHALDEPRLTSWPPGSPRGTGWDQLTADLEDTLLAARRRHSAVSVEFSIVRGAPGVVLRQVSKPDSLLVVGCRGLGGFTGLLLGSVSRTALQSSRGPVAVVRAGDLDPTTTVGGPDDPTRLSSPLARNHRGAAPVAPPTERKNP
jgi:nucleotide-binding universal stress UspA family protein